MCDGLLVRSEAFQLPTVLLGLTQRASLFLLLTVCCILVTFQELQIVKCLTVFFHSLKKKIILWSGFQTAGCWATSQCAVTSRSYRSEPHFHLDPALTIDVKDFAVVCKMKVCVCGGGYHHSAQSYRVWGFLGFILPYNLWEPFYQTRLILWLN